MYVRLAFAVAAHLEPEILIVDEVLAVGDASFQKKCLGRMNEVARQGRTVLFVSHNMAAVQALCRSAVVMSRGKLEFIGNVDEAMDRYMAAGISNQAAVGAEPNEFGVQMQGIELIDAATGRSTDVPVFARDYQLAVRLAFHQPIGAAAIIVRVYDEIGALIGALCSAEEGAETTRFAGELNCTYYLPRLPLIPRGYVLEVSVEDLNGPGKYLNVEALRFHVQPAIVRGGSWAYVAKHGYVRLADGVTITPE
jgi:lipopolysaccharide transport system ATP-binding protein